MTRAQRARSVGPETSSRVLRAGRREERGGQRSSADCGGRRATPGTLPSAVAGSLSPRFPSPVGTVVSDAHALSPGAQPRASQRGARTVHGRGDGLASEGDGRDGGQGRLRHRLVARGQRAEPEPAHPRARAGSGPAKDGVYVEDGSGALRRPSGRDGDVAVVTGASGAADSTDGNGAAATFVGPVVIAGSPGSPGDADGVGPAAKFGCPTACIGVPGGSTHDFP